MTVSMNQTLKIRGTCPLSICDEYHRPKLDMNGEGQHFVVNAGGSLSLSDLALVRGHGYQGGAVNVALTGWAMFDRISFFNNSATQGQVIHTSGTTIFYKCMTADNFGDLKQEIYLSNGQAYFLNGGVEYAKSTCLPQWRCPLYQRLGGLQASTCTKQTLSICNTLLNQGVGIVPQSRGCVLSSSNQLTCTSRPSCPPFDVDKDENIITNDCRLAATVNVPNRVSLSISGALDKPVDRKLIASRGSVLIENGGGSRMFIVGGKLTLKNLIIKGGRGKQSAGGVDIQQGIGIFISVSFVDNSASRANKGSAVTVGGNGSPGSAIFANVSFVDNVQKPSIKVRTGKIVLLDSSVDDTDIIIAAGQKVVSQCDQQTIGYCLSTLGTF